ncbi:MAG: PTS sugar transporter subunit IIA [Mycoplasma sp.]
MNKNIKILMNAEVSDLDNLFDFLSQEAEKNNVVKKAETFKKALLEREKIGSTGLENNIAIPHAISTDNLKSFIFVVKLKNSIEWETLDGTDVKVAICLAVPKANQTDHLIFLQKISIMLLNKEKQDLLKNGTLKDIQKLFSEIDFETSGQTNNAELKQSIKQISDKSEAEIEQEELVNLILLKKELVEASLKGDVKASVRLKEIENEIIQTKKSINILKNELRNKKQTMKKEFLDSKTKVINKISKLKDRNKKDISSLKIKNNKEKEIFIKENQDHANFKENLNKLNLQNYNEIAALTKDLDDAKIEKINLISNYNAESKKVLSHYHNILSKKRFSISNEKNFLYKHSNKFQLILMIALMLVGLWAIVLGGLGITTAESFIKNYENWNTVNVDIVNMEELTRWITKSAASNSGLAISSLVFGIISIIAIIPLKIFKVSNVMKEKIAISVVIASLAIVITSLFIAISSFDNIKAYSQLSKDAVALNSPFHSLIIFKDGLKTQVDFETTKQWDSYVWNMGVELKKYTGSDKISQENFDAAIIKAQAEATKIYNQIILGIAPPPAFIFENASFMFISIKEGVIYG